MKPMLALLAILGGLLVSFGSFAAGLAFAVYVLAVEPVALKEALTSDVAELWTAQARKIDPAAQDFERIAAAPAAQTVEATAKVEPPKTTVDTPEGVDETTTASIEPAADSVDTETAALVEAHVGWCADRYRSYRPRDNSYTPYSGGRRECVSPYSDMLTNASGTAPQAVGLDPDADPSLAPAQADVAWAEENSDPGTYLSADHIDYCFSRYRSYDPSDNSYQPYGGGPRQQCR